jgi:hypothetical protein
MIWILSALVLWLVYRDLCRSSWQSEIAAAVTERLIRLEQRTGLIDEDGEVVDEDYYPDGDDPPEESGTGRPRWASDR